MKNERGLIVVLSGPAGSGKDTLLNAFFEQGGAAKTISATTRAPRVGETNGVDYYFYSKEEFEQAIEEQKLLEYTSYCGNYYGTLNSEVERICASGLDVVLKIEVEGGMAIRRLLPEALLVFLLPPSAEELARRLRARGSETPEVIKARLARAAEELVYGLAYDYLLINDDVYRAAGELAEIIRTEKKRIFRNKEIFDEVTNHVKTIISE